MAQHDETKAVEPRKRVEDTVWVLCMSPVTLPMPEATGKGEVPLKLERGVNVLAGYVPDGNGGVKYLTLDGLSPELQLKPPEERGPAVLKLFEEAKKVYAPMFEQVGKVQPRILAIGTIGKLATGQHVTSLITAATNGTHRASLEALVNLPADLVPEHIKELARTRLTAWRPAA